MHDQYRVLGVTFAPITCTSFHFFVSKDSCTKFYTIQIQNCNRNDPILSVLNTSDQHWHVRHQKNMLFTNALSSASPLGRLSSIRGLNALGMNEMADMVSTACTWATLNVSTMLPPSGLLNTSCSCKAKSMFHRTVKTLSKVSKYLWQTWKLLWKKWRISVQYTVWHGK